MQTPRAWRLASLRHGVNPAWRARFCAVRVTPAHYWRVHGLAAEVCCRANAISVRRRGLSTPGWQQHVVLPAIAYCFLQQERGRRGQTQPTLPRLRAVIQEVLTAQFFMTHPGYLEWMLTLNDVQLRI